MGLSARQRTVAGAVVQLTGFALGLGMLVWAVRLALGEDNREQLERLAQAGIGEMALMVALCVASMVLNGLAYWVAIRPATPVGMVSTQAVNAIAYLLAYLPFKLSLVWRVVAHHRRDGVPMVLIMAWIGAVGVLILVGMGPPAVASLWRGAMDGPWWAVSVGGIVALGVLAVMTARVLSSPGVWDGIARAAAMLAGGWAQRTLTGSHGQRMRAGVGLLASPRAVALGVAIRAADLAVQAARFLLAASVLGVDLTTEEAVLGASAFFLLGAISPAGTVGLREAGTIGALHVAKSEALSVLVLAVSAAEALTTLGASAVAVIWLRPRWLLRLAHRGRSPIGRGEIRTSASAAEPDAGPETGAGGPGAGAGGV